MFRTCMEKHANQAFTRSRYPVKKLNVYMAGGVGKYWVVDPGEKRVIRHIFADRELADRAVFNHPGT